MKAIGNKVIVIQEKLEQASKVKGLIVVQNRENERIKGRIHSVGKAVTEDLKEGDVIWYNHLSGTHVTIENDGVPVEYKVLRQDDIIAIER